MDKRKILVTGNKTYEHMIEESFGITSNNISDFISNPEEYRFILFDGGADVCPKLYEDTSPKNLCFYDFERDKRDLNIAAIATINKTPMVGICRGIQFLNVFAGGKLMHHITGHSGNDHMFTDRFDNIFKVTSTHHQMVIPAPGSHLVGWSSRRLSSLYIGRNDEEVLWNKPETEAIILPRIKACGVQYHPEMMSYDSSGRIWFTDFITKFLNNPMDEFISYYVRNKKVIGHV